MFEVFTYFADWLAYQLIGLSSDTRLGEAVHFFIEDTTKNPRAVDRDDLCYCAFPCVTQG